MSLYLSYKILYVIIRIKNVAAAAKNIWYFSFQNNESNLKICVFLINSLRGNSVRDIYSNNEMSSLTFYLQNKLIDK